MPGIPAQDMEKSRLAGRLWWRRQRARRWDTGPKGLARPWPPLRAMKDEIDPQVQEV